MKLLKLIDGTKPSVQCVAMQVSISCSFARAAEPAARLRSVVRGELSFKYSEVPKTFEQRCQQVEQNHGASFIRGRVQKTNDSGGRRVVSAFLLPWPMIFSG
jgi:hypothetical protein